jgi:hypothetical protein
MILRRSLERAWAYYLSHCEADQTEMPMISTQQRRQKLRRALFTISMRPLNMPFLCGLSEIQAPGRIVVIPVSYFE